MIEEEMNTSIPYLQIEPTPYKMPLLKRESKTKSLSQSKAKARL